MLITALLATPVAAQRPAATGLPSVTAGTPAMPGPAEAMMQGMKTMNDAMASAPMTGDADKDFVAVMLPHHQCAVDMAKVELRYGKDPALLKLARDIVAAQDREIAQMQAWQAGHPTP